MQLPKLVLQQVVASRLDAWWANDQATVQHAATEASKQRQSACEGSMCARHSQGHPSVLGVRGLHSQYRPATLGLCGVALELHQQQLLARLQQAARVGLREVGHLRVDTCGCMWALKCVWVHVSLCCCMCVCVCVFAT